LPHLGSLLVREYLYLILSPSCIFTDVHSLVFISLLLTTFCALFTPLVRSTDFHRSPSKVVVAYVSLAMLDSVALNNFSLLPNYYYLIKVEMSFQRAASIRNRESGQISIAYSG
jgi:hypothetical protein